jgi:hypothetical protein
VLVCLVIWKSSGPKTATVATTLAIVIAGLPGMIELWRAPQRFLAWVWTGYTVASLLALAGGTAWSIEERFAPAVFAAQTLVLTGIGLRRKPEASQPLAGG